MRRGEKETEMIGIIIATGLGIVTGYVLCYLMTAAQVADHPQELAQAYWDGWIAGKETIRGLSQKIDD